MFKKKIKINHHLFYETSHSPPLVDIVGESGGFLFYRKPVLPQKKAFTKTFT
jgi:hypothetical protein